MVWFSAFAGTTPGFRVTRYTPGCEPGMTSIEVVQSSRFVAAGLAAMVVKCNEK